jgi:MoxR-vWA-beta-propeller ternary system domain bpX5
MDEEVISVVWRPRSAPLDPVGVAARGESARALARRLLARDDEALARMSGAAAPGLLVVLGASADLPWVDGAVYLGKDASAPSLLLPTTREPSVPLPLVERAFARAAGAPPPLAVLLDPPLLTSLQAARPILRTTLQSWLDRAGGPP